MSKGIMMIFDHIGVFVASLSRGREVLGAILSITHWSEEYNDPLIKVYAQFGEDASGVRYELVAPNGEGNPVDGALTSRTNILNHVAYTTPDLDAEIKRFRELGSFPIGEPQPAVAFGGRRVAFLRTPPRFMIELIEAGPIVNDHYDAGMAPKFSTQSGDSRRSDSLPM